MYRVYHSPPWAFGLFLSIIVLHLSPLIALGSPTNSIALPSPVTIPGGVRTTQQYIIYPGTSRQSKKYKFDLQTLVGPDNVEEYGTPFTGILFWLVDLDAAQVQDFCFGNPSAIVHRNEVIAQRQRQNVSNLEPLALNGSSDSYELCTGVNCRGIAYQRFPPDDLKVVSWPPDKGVKDLNYYAYDRRGGQNVVLYLVEEGIDPRHPEFAFNPTSWRYAPLVSNSRTDDDVKSHGSCVASKAVGTHYGISKGTHVIIMKSSLNESDVLWAIGNIANEMNRRGGSRQKSVILFAFGSHATFSSTRPFILPEPWKKIRGLLQSIIDLDGIIVVPSGNSRVGAYREQSDILPALFTRSLFGYLPLTLVGSCNNDGDLASFSQQSPYIRAWAPGVNVQCAKSSGTVEVDSGTSLSAGMVAGLAAYFLGNSIPPFAVGRGQTALNFNNFLRSEASWRRSNNGVPNMIWNLQDGTKIFPLSNLANVSQS